MLLLHARDYIGAHQNLRSVILLNSATSRMWPSANHLQDINIFRYTKTCHFIADRSEIEWLNLSENIKPGVYNAIPDLVARIISSLLPGHSLLSGLPT
jgi:hypothetical protein